MLNKNFNLKNNYLSKCDLIYKYNLVSAYEAPVLHSIKVSLSLSMILKALDNPKEILDLENQIKAFSFYYLLTSYKPLIKAKLKAITSSEKNKALNYFLNYSISTKSDINSFLINLLIENWNKIRIEKIEILSNKPNSILSATHNSFTASIPLSLLHDANLLLNTINSNINTKEILLNFTFKVKTPKSLNLLNKQLVFKNIPLLWING